MPLPTSVCSTPRAAQTTRSSATAPCTPHLSVTLSPVPPQSSAAKKLAALSPVCTSADTATGRSAGLGAAVFAKEICSLPTSPRCPRRPAERLTRSCSICSAASSPMVSSQLPNPSFPYEKKCKTCSNAATSGRRASRSWGGRGSSAGHCSQPPLGREGTVLAEMLRHCPFPRLIAILGRGGWDSKS